MSSTLETVKDSAPDSLSGWIETVKQVINLTSKDNIGAYSSLVGLVFLGIFAWSAFKLVNQDPRRTKGWQKLMTLVVGAVSLLFIAGGPAYSLLSFGVEQKNIVTDMGRQLDVRYSNNFKSEEIVKRLENNTHVNAVVRLIPYDPKIETELSADRIARASLGNARQRYTFVSDYEELKGYTAATAARMSGLRFRAGQRVTAVIFPLRSPRELIPVNSRGLLQLINRVEADPANPNFKFKDRLSDDARRNLSEMGREMSWAWESYREYYGQYCKLAYEFVCSDPAPASAALLGKVTHDWHPLGFARAESMLDNPCEKKQIQEQNCAVKDLKANELMTKTGSSTRVFMTENSDVKDIDGRIIIDFDQPDKQRIPLINFEQP